MSDLSRLVEDVLHETAEAVRERSKTARPDAWVPGEKGDMLLRALARRQLQIVEVKSTREPGPAVAPVDARRIARGLGQLANWSRLNDYLTGVVSFVTEPLVEIGDEDTAVAIGIPDPLAFGQAILDAADAADEADKPF